jgi:hypothetical protein
LIDKGADIVTLDEKEATAYEATKTFLYHAQGVLIPRMSSGQVLNNAEVDAYLLLQNALREVDEHYKRRWGIDTQPFHAVAKMRWERDTKECEQCRIRFHVRSGSYERHLATHQSVPTTEVSSPKPSGNFLKRWLLSVGSKLVNSYVDL